MRLLILLLFSIPSFGQSTINAPFGAVEIIGVAPFLDSADIIDDGYYNGFPMVADAEGQTTYGVFKKSGSHAAGGPLVLVKTTDGGASWTKTNIKVDGVEISSTNHSFERLSTGRMWISYRVSGVMYFAYNDNNNENFTSSTTVVSPATNYLLAQSPIKMIETSYGTILFAYYQVGSSGNPNSSVIMECALTGTTFSQKAVVYSHTDAWPTNAPYWKGNEIAICETHPTGNEATSKWIAIVRTEIANDGGTYYMFFKSADGANTWTQDIATDNGSFVDDNGVTVTSSAFSRGIFYRFLETNSPVDIRLFGDSVYVVNGERNSANRWALKYTATTPDGAYQNKFDNWRAPTRVKYYNPGGSTTDQGYPMFFTASAGLYIAQYEVSTQTYNPALSTRRIRSQIKKIK